jgi:acid phosphatase type 7
VYSRAAWFSAVLIGVLAAWSHAEPFRKGPYLQNVSSSSITVVWESSPPCAGTVRLLGDAPRAIEVEADHEGLNEVVISGLESGRRYRYAVDCAGETREGEFATAPGPEAPFTFVVFGDTRSNANAHRRVIDHIRREVPDFILSTGDLVDDGNREREWQEFFEIEGPLLRDNVLFPSLGNHDRQGKGRTAHNYRKFFALPENSPDPERYYAFTFGNARVVVLDSNAYSFALTDQTAWLEQQLQAAALDPSIAHVFVSMHHPPYSISLHGGQEELRDRWTPLFEKYGVAAVFSGHDHVYSRAEAGGVHYFVTGGGGAPLYPRGRRPSRLDLEATRYFERVNHYMRVHVIGQLVEVTAIRTDGTIIETVSWGSLPRFDRKAVAMAVGASASSDAAARAGALASGEGALRAGAQDGAMIREVTPGSAGRFGLLGKLGAMLVVFAGGVLVWTLRS